MSWRRPHSGGEWPTTISADVGVHQICAIHYQFTNTVGIQSHLNTIPYNLWSVWFLLLKLLVMLLNTLLVKSRGWQMSWLNFTQLLGLFHLQQILENYISSAKYIFKIPRGTYTNPSWILVNYTKLRFFGWVPDFPIQNGPQDAPLWAARQRNAFAPPSGHRPRHLRGSSLGVQLGGPRKWIRTIWCKPVVYACIYNIYTYIHMYVCVYVDMCICVYVYVSICVYVYMCTCVYVYMCTVYV